MKHERIKYKKPVTSKLYRNRSRARKGDHGECISIDPASYTGSLKVAPAPAIKPVLPFNRDKAKRLAKICK